MFKVLRVLRVFKGFKVSKVFRDFKVSRGLKGFLADREQEGDRVLKVSRVLRGKWVFKGLSGKGDVETKDLRVSKANQEFKDPRDAVKGTQANQGFKDPRA